MDLQPNMNENVDTGTLRIQLTNRSNGIPVQGAKISVSYTGNPSQVIAEVEFVVFLSYLRLDASVLFEYVAVVVVAYQQDTSYPPAHQLCRFYHRCSINVFFVGYIFSLYIYLRRLYFRRRTTAALLRPAFPNAP